ncbi:hypothetical protein BaRGS_00029462 [Batillaria attramentaria]|uniref:Ribosomal protein L14 n=1 Tax=Batillaria attramentaria TaxID=370345 RepID=A0ABD0JWE0_9CAEN
MPLMFRLRRYVICLEADNWKILTPRGTEIAIGECLVSKHGTGRAQSKQGFGSCQVAMVIAHRTEGAFVQN